MADNRRTSKDEEVFAKDGTVKDPGIHEEWGPAFGLAGASADTTIWACLQRCTPSFCAPAGQ